MPPKTNQPPAPLHLTTDSEPSTASPDQDAPEALREQEAIYREALCMTSRLLEMPDMFDLPW
ncbi:MAG: hypothetical protein ACYC63_13990 [Armatimonadota bacterium]